MKLSRGVSSNDGAGVVARGNKASKTSGSSGDLLRHEGERGRHSGDKAELEHHLEVKNSSSRSVQGFDLEEKGIQEDLADQERIAGGGRECRLPSQRLAKGDQVYLSLRPGPTCGERTRCNDEGLRR